MALLVVAATGCEREPSDELEFLVRSFSVSGTVFDSSESLPGVPLEDVSVSICVYWYFDTDRTGEPIYSAVYHTGSDGHYEFYKSWSMTMQNVYYILRVFDESSQREIHFKPVEQELYMRPNTDAYDDIMHSYAVRDNDFYLLPETF